ncbi:MAG: hypothetical protein U0792_08945 [Gemmataceae bacterium]
MAEATQKKLQKLVRQLGRLVLAAAETGLNGEKGKAKAKPRNNNSLWVSAYLDARWFSDAEGFISKVRVVLPNGDLYGLLRVTHDMKALLEKVWGLRKEDSFAQWYGLKITVNSDGVISTDFNNDPNCVVDPMWYHS